MSVLLTVFAHDGRNSSIGDVELPGKFPDGVECIGLKLSLFIADLRPLPSSSRRLSYVKAIVPTFPYSFRVFCETKIVLWTCTEVRNCYTGSYHKLINFCFPFKTFISKHEYASCALKFYLFKVYRTYFQYVTEVHLIYSVVNVIHIVCVLTV